MPLTKYRTHFPYAREELDALVAWAHLGDVDHGGRYHAHGGVVDVWSHAWRPQALRDESTLVGGFFFDWLTERLVHIEWDEGFALADLLHELALLETHALGAVKHGQWRPGGA